MRLIDADALKKEVNKKKVVGRFNTLLLIDNAPTVSEITKEKLSNAYDQGYEDGKNNWLQEERPQGEWIEIPVKRDLLYNTGIKYTCSICGKGNCYGKPPFCMYCGAKMKGGKE